MPPLTYLCIIISGDSLRTAELHAIRACGDPLRTIKSPSHHLIRQYTISSLSSSLSLQFSLYVETMHKVRCRHPIPSRYCSLSLLHLHSNSSSISLYITCHHLLLCLPFSPYNRVSSSLFRLDAIYTCIRHQHYLPHSIIKNPGQIVTFPPSSLFFILRTTLCKTTLFTVTPQSLLLFSFNMFLIRHQDCNSFSSFMFQSLLVRLTIHRLLF